MNLTLNPRRALAFFGFFILFYALFFTLWMQVKDPYNRFFTETGFRISAWKYDLHVAHSSMKGREMTFILSNTTPIMGPRGMMAPFEIELSLDIESVTFNVPMTLSLLAALIVSFGGHLKVQLKLALLGLGALMALHLVTVVVISTSLYAGTTQSTPVLHFYFSRFWMNLPLLENLGMILNSYAARFEPFLIGIVVLWKIQLMQPKRDDGAYPQL